MYKARVVLSYIYTSSQTCKYCYKIVKIKRVHQMYTVIIEALIY